MVLWFYDSVVLRFYDSTLLAKPLTLFIPPVFCVFCAFCVFCVFCVFVRLCVCV
jgi:hypothetical protein